MKEESTPHLTVTTIERFSRGRLAGGESFRLLRHVEVCAECAALARGRIDVDRAALRLEAQLFGSLSEEHPGHDVLSRHVDGKLPRESRGAVQEHLLLCAVCREDVEDLQSMRRIIDGRRNRWRIGLSIAATLIVGIVSLWVGWPGTPARRDSGLTKLPRSMAVLPLLNVELPAGDEFLSVGIADALVTRLQQIPSLYVRPMSSILKMEPPPVDARAAARMLDVDGIIEGQLETVDERVHVRLKLIDRSGRTVWSDSVHGPRADLFKLVDNVTARAADGLRVQRSARRRSSQPRSDNPEAYEWYLKARSSHGLVPEDFRRHLASLERAIDLDPRFAAAHADLAIALATGISRSLRTEPDPLATAAFHAREAVRLDPNLAAAHIAMGRVLVRRPDRYREAMSEILHALRLNSTDTNALQVLVRYFAAIGDLERFHCVGDRIIRLDPTSDEARARGYWYLAAADPHGALRAAEHAFADPSSAMFGHDVRGQALVVLGDLEPAHREAAAMLGLVPDHYLGESLMAMIAAARGDRTLMESWLARFEEDAAHNHHAAARVAFCYARLGDQDAALRWLAHSVALGDHNLYSFVMHPWLASLRSDPRFTKVMAPVRSDLEAVRKEVMDSYPLICGDSLGTPLPRQAANRHSDVHPPSPS